MFTLVVMSLPRVCFELHYENTMIYIDKNYVGFSLMGQRFYLCA